MIPLTMTQELADRLKASQDVLQAMFDSYQVDYSDQHPGVIRLNDERKAILKAHIEANQKTLNAFGDEEAAIQGDLTQAEAEKLHRTWKEGR